MAVTKHSENNVRPARRPGVMERIEYQQRARELAVRGHDLPQAKLLDLDVIAIRSAARQRESLRTHIRNVLSNDALAKQFNVHRRTIEKVLSTDTWCHI